MKIKTLLALLIILISVFDASAQRLSLDTLDPFIHRLMNDFDIPGLSIGIVQDGSMIYTKGFGTREVKKDLEVNEPMVLNFLVDN